MKYVADLAAVFDTAAHRNTALTALENQLPADATVRRFRARTVGTSRFFNDSSAAAVGFLVSVEFDQQADRAAWFNWIKTNAQNANGLIRLAGRRHDCGHDESDQAPCEISEWKVWP